MSKHGSEPDEALGPAVNGLDALKSLIIENAAREETQGLDGGKIPLESDYIEDGTDIEVIEEPVALFCGSGPEVEAAATLAANCGFNVELAVNEADEDLALAMPQARKIHVTPDFEDFVAACGIGKNHFVCIFEDDITDCELILSQCLASDACYLGLSGDMQKRSEVFARLKEDGAPDAELAAVCCPIGLNIRAVTPAQLAVGVVAELLAARGGTLKRLRHGERARPR